MTQNGVSLYFSIKNSPDPKRSPPMAADLNHARMPIGPVGHGRRRWRWRSMRWHSSTRSIRTRPRPTSLIMMEAPQYDHWLTDSFGYWAQPLKAYEGERRVEDAIRRLRPTRTRWPDSLWLGYKPGRSTRRPAPSWPTTSWSIWWPL